MLKTIIYDLKTQYEEGMDTAAKLIRSGGLVAMPTETVYGLAADAQNEAAVKSIFTVKGRPQDNPLIVHIADISRLDELVYVTPLAKKLADAFWPGPLTLVLKKRPGVIPDAVSCGLDTVAVRLPASEYARELILRSGRFIAAPSANISGRPSPTRASHVYDDFNGSIPVILDGGASQVGLESTVCAAHGALPVILRPGGITEEMIIDAVGGVTVAPAVLKGMKEGERAASPGMKYKHYSPKAKVYIADGDSKQAKAQAACRLYDELSGNTLILCLADTLDMLGGRQAKTTGDTAEDMARELFSELRLADDEGRDNVIIEAVPLNGMGLAIMNRALRAAGFKVVKNG